MAVVKGAKKKFFEVKVPLTASKVHIIGYSAEELDGSIIKLDLTRSLRGKSLELKARVKNENGSLVGTPLSLEIIPSYIRRIFRKGVDYVEDSFEAPCKDTTLQIKPFLLTRKRVSRAIRNEIRQTARKHIEAHVKIRTAEEVLSEVTSNKIQKELSLKLKKIYPLALCEIRSIAIVQKKVVPTAEAK